MVLTTEDLTDVFERYLQNLGIGFLLYDIGKKTIYHVNDQLQILLGYSQNELKGAGIDILGFSTNSRLGDPSENDLSESLFSNTERTQFRGHCVRKGGDTIQVQLEVDRTLEHGNYKVIFVREIDEPLNLWQSNEQRNEDLKPLVVEETYEELFDSDFFEHNPLPYLICDHNDQIIRWNTALRELLEYPSNEIPAKSFDLVAFAPHNNRSLVSLLKENPRVHLALRKYDGKAIIVEAQAKAVAENESDQYVIVLQAVSESQLSTINESYLHPLQKSAPGATYFMLKLNDELEIMFGNKACWDCLREEALAKQPAKLKFDELLHDPDDRAAIKRIHQELREEKVTDATIPLSMYTPSHGKRNIIWNISSLWNAESANRRYVLVGMPAKNNLEATELSELLDYRRETEMHHEQLTLQSLIEGQELERAHISRELHDSLGQILIASRRTLNQHIRNHQGTDVTALQNLKSNLDEAITEVRRISHGLATGVLNDHGLVAALENMLTQINNSDIDVKFEPVVSTNKSFGSAVETAFYRIGQEVCTNALKHSSCSEIELKIEYREDLLEMIIRDNGIGMLSKDQQAKGTGTGIRNLYSRAYLIGADIMLKSDAREGTTFKITYALD